LVIADGGQRLEEATLLSLVDERTVAILCSDDEITAEVISHAPRLKVIAKWGTGTDSVDLSAAAHAGVTVVSSPGAFTDAVADTALGLILMFGRRLRDSDRVVRQGSWDQLPGVSLRTQVVGVIGVGRIGTAVLRRAHAFGSELFGCDVRPDAGAEISQLGLSMLSMGELLARADFICVCCDLNPTSHHLIGREQFRAMKRTAVIVNVARGPIVDEAALVDALQEGVIGGAALDVFEHEPLPLDSPLRRHPNVVLSPHNAFHAVDAVKRVHENTVHAALRALEELAGVGESRKLDRGS